MSFYDELVAHGLLLPTGVDGIPGRGGVFEKVMRHFDGYLTRSIRLDEPEEMHFPPAINRRIFENAGFLQSFPQLVGSVFSFTGTEKEHRELIARLDAHEPWQDLQTMTDVCLTASACYPVYPLCTGTLPADGRLIDLWAYCFRHEPSLDPARMQMFRMRENIRMGDKDTVLRWRAMWMERGVALLKALELPVELVAASDPFFGRAGKMLAANQKEQGLKFEVVVPINSTDNPTAIMSFNYHREHFTAQFDIRTPDGALAQTACLGFGMERCVLALFKVHGFDPNAWPTAVRGLLWP